jgi:murein tripeptide amidase MpaA
MLPLTQVPASAQTAEIYKLDGVVVDQKYIRLEIHDITEVPPETKFSLRRAELKQEQLTYDGQGKNRKIANDVGIDNTSILKEDFLMPLKNGHGKGKFEYFDFDVKPAHYYAYWLTKNKNEIVQGPFLLKVRDPNVLLSQATIESKMAALQQKYPTLAKVVTFGKTFQNRDMNAIVIGNPNNAVLMVGATHAGESGAEQGIYAAETILAQERDLLKKVGLIVIPVYNIDGRERLISGHANYLRKNANTVDLNRNMEAGWDVVESRYGTTTATPAAGTYRGPAPNSEPETKALVSFLSNYKPKVGFFYHQLGDGYQYHAASTNLHGDVIRFGSAYYRGKVANPSAVVTDVANGVLQPEKPPGTTQQYCAEKLGIVCFTVESQWGLRTPAELRNSDDWTTAEDMREFEKAHYRGILAVLKSLK